MTKDTESAAIRKVIRGSGRDRAIDERLAAVDSYDRKHAPQPQDSSPPLDRAQAASGRFCGLWDDARRR